MSLPSKLFPIISSTYIALRWKLFMKKILNTSIIRDMKSGWSPPEGRPPLPPHLWIFHWKLLLWMVSLTLTDYTFMSFLLVFPYSWCLPNFLCLPVFFVVPSTQPSVPNFLPASCVWGVKSKIVPSGASASGLGLLPVRSGQGGNLPPSCRQVQTIVPQLILSYHHHALHCP